MMHDVAEAASGGLIRGEAVEDLITMGDEATKNVSILQLGEYTHSPFQVPLFLVLEITDPLLVAILGILVMLITLMRCSTGWTRTCEYQSS